MAPLLQRRSTVTLFPMHHLILTAHCTNLPSFPISRPNSTKDTVQLPVIPLCLPSLETYPILQSYLYTKCIGDLLRSLLPPSSLSQQATSVSEMVSILTCGSGRQHVKGGYETKICEESGDE